MKIAIYIFFIAVLGVACQSPSGSGPGGKPAEDDERHELFKGQTVRRCKAPSSPDDFKTCLGRDPLRAETLLSEIRKWPTANGKWQSYWFQVESVRARHILTDREVYCLEFALCEHNEN